MTFPALPRASWLVLLAACSTQTVHSPPPAPVQARSLQAHPRPDASLATASGERERERTIAEVYASALASPDFSALAPHLGADAHFLLPGVLDVRGRDAVVRAHALVFGAFVDRRVALRRVLRASATQLVEWTFSGIQRRDWLDVTATDRTAVFEGLAVLTTREDETIADVRLYFDVASVKAQLGKGPGQVAPLSPPRWPSAPTQVIEQHGSPDELSNTDTVRRWLDALDDVDRSAYVHSVSEDVEVSAPEAPLARGRDAEERYFKTVHDEIAQLETRIDALWPVGDFVGIEYTITGEQVAPIGWVPKVRDRVVRLQMADIIELHDGRISRVWRYYNLAQANEPGP